MKKILGLVALLLVVSPALAVDNATIAYTLEIGGNNHAAQVKAGTAVAYTAGNPADGQTLVTGPVNWAVRATVTGEHGGFTAYGAANLVWDLELRDAANNLVAVGKGAPGTAGFYSEINDGTAGNPLQAAAFAFGYADGPGDPAHIYDAVSANGPHLAQKTYPSTNAFPAGAPSDGSLSGKLVGMGAGYQDFKASSNTERPGVGVEGTFDVGCTGLASGPVAEGQIDLTGLPGGNYTLKVVAGNGNNVLRGDMEYSCNGDASGNFAVKADVVTGDTLTFAYAPIVVCTKPALAAAFSRKDHVDATTDPGNPVHMIMDLPLNTTGGATIEPRNNVDPLVIVVRYNQNVAGTATVVPSTGTLGTVTMSGTDVIIPLTGVADRACVSVVITNVKDSTQGCTSDPVTVKVAMRKGDVSQLAGSENQVNVSDVAAIRSRSSSNPVTAANFIYDVNLNGFVNVQDVAFTRALSSSVLTDACSN